MCPSYCCQSMHLHLHLLKLHLHFALALTAFIEAEAVCISTVELLRTKDAKAMRI